MSEQVCARDLKAGDVMEGLNGTTLPVVAVDRDLFWDGAVDDAPVLVDNGPFGSWRYHPDHVLDLVEEEVADEGPVG